MKCFYKFENVRELLSKDIIVNSQRKKDRCPIKICKDAQLIKYLGS